MAITARMASTQDAGMATSSIYYAQQQKKREEAAAKHNQEIQTKISDSHKPGLFDGITDFISNGVNSAKDAISNIVNNVTNPSRQSSGSGGSGGGFGSSDAGSSDLSAQFESLIDKIYDIQTSNNAQMIENANRQMAFQEQSQAKTMQFNAEQAKLDRDWQEYMSNTAHQREVGDLISAGLNPVLSANAGASTGSGASASASSQSGSLADVDTSITNFMGNLAGAMASMHNAEVSAKAAMGSASIQAAAMKAAAKYGMYGALGGAGLRFLRFW